MEELVANKPSLVTKAEDQFSLLGTDYIEFYVGNAKQAAHYYQSVYGFSALARSGLETGVKDRESYVVRQNKITLVFTSPLHSGTDISSHVDIHGDGVKVCALTVKDSRKSFGLAISRGAEPYFEPVKMSDEHGSVWLSGIKIYGDTVHLFVERGNYDGVFLPGYEIWRSSFGPSPIGLEYVDHMVANVAIGEMNRWVEFYREVMGFHQIISFDDKDISTKYTALMSKVMSNGNGRIKFPINEPASGLKSSQVEEYLNFYEGPGVQHIALATNDIVHTVSQMQRNGAEFLEVPQSYYENLRKRIGIIDEDIDTLSQLGILVDRDDQGYLLQIFTKTVNPRPTLFFEIIQRKGATSFGKGNFKALFEAIEREQALRGTL